VVYAGSDSSFTLTNLLPGNTYHVGLFAYNANGAATVIDYLQANFVRASQATNTRFGSTAPTALPQGLSLYGQRNTLYLQFASAQQANAQIQVLDVSGRLLTNVDNTSNRPQQQLQISHPAFAQNSLLLVRIVNDQQATTIRVIMQ